MRFFVTYHKDKFRKRSNQRAYTKQTKAQNGRVCVRFVLALDTAPYFLLSLPVTLPMQATFVYSLSMMSEYSGLSEMSLSPPYCLK